MIAHWMLGYLLVMCLLGLKKPWKPTATLCDPISALATALASSLPEVGAAAIPEFAASALPEIAGDVLLPDVLVSAAAPAFGLGDLAAGLGTAALGAAPGIAGDIFAGDAFGAGAGAGDAAGPGISFSAPADFAPGGAPQIEVPGAGVEAPPQGTVALSSQDLSSLGATRADFAGQALSQAPGAGISPGSELAQLQLQAVQNAIDSGATIDGISGGIAGFDPATGQITITPAAAQAAAGGAIPANYSLTPADLANLGAAPDSPAVVSKVNFLNQVSALNPEQALQQAQQGVIDSVLAAGGPFNSAQGPISDPRLVFDPNSGSFTISGTTPAPAAAPTPSAPVDLSQQDLVSVGAPTSAPAAPAAPPPPPAPPPAPPPLAAAGSPNFLSSLFNSLNPVGPANAAEFGGVQVPDINMPTMQLGGSPGGTGATSPQAGGTSAGGSASSVLTGNLQPGGGASLAAQQTGLSPASPGQAPPELTSLDTSSAGSVAAPDTSTSTAGAPAGQAAAAAAPVSSTVSGPVDATAATAAAPPPAAPAATATPTGSVANALGTGDIDVGGTMGEGGSGGGAGTAAKAGGGLFQGIKDFTKENSGLLTLGGLGASLLMSLFNKPEIPTGAAAAAGSAALPVAQSNIGNAAAAQGPAQSSFNTAASALIPTSEAGITTAANAANPIISQQTGLSGGEAANAQPLLSADVTGVLPPGEANAIAAALGSSRAAIESSYGNLGLAGSTTEAQDLSAASGNILSQLPGILNNLVTTGIQESTASSGNAGTALQGVNSILSAIQGLSGAVGTETGAAGGVTSAASGVTNAVNAINNAANTAANTDINIAQLQLTEDQELQQALQALGKNLALSQISPSTLNVAA